MARLLQMYIENKKIKKLFDYLTGLKLKILHKKTRPSPSFYLLQARLYKMNRRACEPCELVCEAKALLWLAELEMKVWH